MSDVDPVNAPGATAETGPPAAGSGGRRRRRFRLDPRRDAWMILVVLGVLLVLNLGFSLFVLRPQRQTVAQLESEKANFNVTYREAKRDAEAIQADYETAVDRAEEYRVFYDEELSTSRLRLGMVQAEIWSIGDQFGTEPFPLNLAPKDMEDEGVQHLSISFPLDGGYENLRRFIDALESSDQLFIIDRITLTENRAQSGALRLSIDVSTFFNAPYQVEMKKTSRRDRRQGGRR